MQRILGLLYIILIQGCTSSIDNIYGYDYRLFDNSPVEDLAEAVEDEDTSKIKELVQNERLYIDYAEPKYGNTLLMLAVTNQQYNSTKMLLKLGADPNKHNSFSGESAMIIGAEIETYPKDVDFIKLLLFYKGDPNYEEIGPRPHGNTARRTPLIAACGDVTQGYSPIEKVKILIKSGANVNYTNEFSAFALQEALILENYDVALYLLEKGADYNKMLFNRGDYIKGGEKIYILNFLRECFLLLDSKEYKDKMAIVHFLKEKGLEYEKAPLPNYAEEKAKELYPNMWKEYLEKY